MTIWRIAAGAAGLGAAMGGMAGLMVGVFTLPDPLASGVSWFFKGAFVGAMLSALLAGVTGVALRRRFRAEARG